MSEEPARDRQEHELSSAVRMNGRSTRSSGEGTPGQA